MAFSAKVILDSVAPCGKRLTTIEATYPRFIHCEALTHRELSRNSSSSRAIPVHKTIDRVMSDPVLPVHWGKNQKGMQAEEELSEEERRHAAEIWLTARDSAVSSAELLLKLGVHKQIANRILEPFSWITTLVTATTWENFFALRCHPAAQPELKLIATMIREAMNASIPEIKCVEEWHLPYLRLEDWEMPLADCIKVSVARCARVSYLTHDGVRDVQKDLDLCNSLISSGHMSPLEHAAAALDAPERHGNFIGWMQYRKYIPFEENFGARPA